MIDLDTYVTSARMEGVRCTFDECLRLYDGVLSLWEQYGWRPDRIAGIRPSRSGFFDTFDDSRRHPTKELIKLDDGITIERMASNWKSDRDWAASASLNKAHAYQLLCQTQLGIGADVTVEISRQFLMLMSGRYAYILRQLRRCGYYQMHATEFEAHLKRPRDHSMNISWWSLHLPASVDACLLRDIYPHNFLSQAYLGAKLGRTDTTLRAWIEANPAERGELKPFSDVLTEWTPPVENIPVIREALFRAGRVFYWRFFNSMNRRTDAPSVLHAGWRGEQLYEPDRYHRSDAVEPWEATDPIPEIYDASFYDDKDPGLIY